MTPEEYRAKWNLPADYPMVAPGYSATRSRLAKELGLGRTKEQMAKPKLVSERDEYRLSYLQNATHTGPADERAGPVESHHRRS